MRIILLSAALLATGVASAATPVDGWYTSFFLGYSYLPDNVSNGNYGVLYNASSYGGSYNIGGRIGYQSNPIRYEAEYTYLAAKVRSFNVNYFPQTGVTGNAYANFLMANIYYDTPEILPGIYPFLGVGIGYSNLQTELYSTGPNGYAAFTASDNAFAYQGTVGLTYNFAENYAANISYRYTATGNNSNFGKAFQAQIANAALIWRFDNGNYK